MIIEKEFENKKAHHKTGFFTQYLKLITYGSLR